MNIKKIHFSFFILMANLVLLGCTSNSIPRPDKMDESEMTFRVTSLLPYSTPPCTPDTNSVECDYLNFGFEIDASTINKDTMVFWEKANPQNTIKIFFDGIIDQDGVYEISTYIPNEKIYRGVRVKISGNKLGTKIIEKSLYNGKLYFKTLNGKYDIIICGGLFEYYVNVTKVANFNAHFVILK